MKLQERFSQQAKHTPTDMQKMRMYQQFLDKSHRSISYHKVSYYAKIAVFSLGLFILGGTVYYSGKPLTDNPFEILKEGDGYTTLQGFPGQFVQADTIGKIISTQGQIEITHNNTEIETENLTANDRVILSKGAEMLFRIDDHVHAKIIGPAEFILEDAGYQEGMKKYVINLISGDYLEVVTLSSQEISDTQLTKKSAGGGTVSVKKPASQVSVKAADFTLEQVDIRGNLDLVISTTEDGKKHVENKGTEIVMKKIVEEKQTYIAIQQDESVSVNGHIEFVYDQNTTEELLAKAQETKLTVRYEVTESGDESSTSLEIASDILARSDSLKKKVIPEELANFLETSLHTETLQRYIDDMRIHMNTGNQEGFAIAYTNLLEKLAQAYTLAEMPFAPIKANSEALSVGSQAIVLLTQTLQTQRYADPILLQGLKTTAISLQSLALHVSVEKASDTPLKEYETKNNEIKKEEKTIATGNTIEELPTHTFEDILQGVVDPIIPLQ